MSDMISRDAAIRALVQAHEETGVKTAQAIRIIRELPAAEPERKHGEWEGDGTCPFCQERPLGRYATIKNFCPNCGADLRGGNR